MASRMYHIFHIVVEEGSHARHSMKEVMNSWTPLLGQRVLRLSDYKKLAEVVVSAIEVNEGKDADSVASSWSSATSLIVARAVGDLAKHKGGSKIVRYD